MSWGKTAHLPKEALILNSAVPVFTSAGDAANLFTSGLTEMNRFDFTNSTSATINMTIVDASGKCVGGFSNFPIDPSTPNDYQFQANPLRYVGGVRMWAVSAGVFVNAEGWQTTQISGVLSAYNSNAAP